MPFCKLIRIGAVVVGLALVPCFAQSGNTTNSGPRVTEHASDFDDGGRRVSIKPISEIGFGGIGHGDTGWVLGGGLTAITVLFGFGALVTAKLLK